MVRGRRKGSTEYEVNKAAKHHFMTPVAHNWIRANKRWIEWAARDANLVLPAIPPEFSMPTPRPPQPNN